jgi:hypothetical protein
MSKCFEKYMTLWISVRIIFIKYYRTEIYPKSIVCWNATILIQHLHHIVVSIVGMLRIDLHLSTATSYYSPTSSECMLSCNAGSIDWACLLQENTNYAVSIDTCLICLLYNITCVNKHSNIVLLILQTVVLHYCLYYNITLFTVRKILYDWLYTHTVNQSIINHSHSDQMFVLLWCL